MSLELESPEEHDAVWANIEQNPTSSYAQRVEKYGWSNFPLIDKVALNFFGKAIPNMLVMDTDGITKSRRDLHGTIEEANDLNETLNDW